MPNWHRRSILATGAALSTTGALASISATTEEAALDTSSGPTSTGDPDGWSSAWGNAANSNYLPLEDEFPEPETVAWRYKLPSMRTWHDGTVAAVDGRIYLLTNYERTDERIGGLFQSYETELHAIDADDGELDWQAAVEATGRPTVADGMVYVNGRDSVTAYDAADGSVRWERKLDTVEWITNPTAADGTLYVVAGEALYALDGDDGSIQWRREQVTVRAADDTDESVSTSFATELVAVVDGTVYAITTPCPEDSPGAVALEDGVAALDATTGDTEWAVAPEGGVSTSLVASEAFVFGMRVVDMHGGPLLDPDTGDVVQQETQTTVAATPDARVTVPFPGSSDISVYPSDDGERWTAPDASEPLIAGDTLIAFRDGSVVGFDLETGAVTWQWEGGPSSTRTLVAVDENTLYAGFDDGIVALRPSDDENEGDECGEDDEDEGDENDGDECGEDDEDEGDENDGDEGDEDDTDSDCPREGAGSARADQ
ncbi:PQQ-binding-like beta-propeller repeat protein [Natrinema salaciae]|uniref:PQQ-like domain-containing protein n=1 Tax=Natrinema salaciae TaxID=1186196 RepID=A0A1H9MFD8_9EURY|nr:PQQ-binding-like beta-propeller repeat protein [Natrinema salaciae]SER21873.1 PQQ-like domain-containing protein [Natrinema salaciae]